ncbi:hypothetical protein RUND412_001496 [Rhizina undulata]
MPPEVKRVALDFAFKNKDGHMGARKFWKKYMPRLKYHNPEVQMDVMRRREEGSPATMTIEFDGDRKEVVDIQNKHENDICKAVFELTKARELPINENDSRLAEEYLAQKALAKKREAEKEARMAAKREAARLNGPISSAL